VAATAVNGGTCCSRQAHFGTSPSGKAQAQAEQNLTNQAPKANGATHIAQPGLPVSRPNSLDDVQYQAAVDAAVKEIVSLSPELRDWRRKEVLAKFEKFGLRASTLDELIKRAGGNGDDLVPPSQLVEHEPWPETVDGDALLHDLVAEAHRHVVMSEDDALVSALWCISSYMYKLFVCFLRLAIVAPARDCGKTTLFDFISRLVNRADKCSAHTEATLFRTIADEAPTLLIDEFHTTIDLHRKNDTNASAILRIFNLGHRYDGQVPRCVPAGDDWTVERFPVYGPMAVALIGQLPDEQQSRSFSVHLKRKLDNQSIKKMRIGPMPELDVLARKIRRWTDDNQEAVAKAYEQDPYPDMPTEVFNRAADNWTPLFVVADVIGGEWPAKVRAAAVAAVGASQTESRRVELLRDLQSIFSELDATKGNRLPVTVATSGRLGQILHLDRGQPDRIASREVVLLLNLKEDRPWKTYNRGREITELQVANLLDDFEIRPSQLRFKINGSGTRLKGYLKVWFEDAWARYLSPCQTPENETL
jgi:putative DNA primase/helicase